MIINANDKYAFIKPSLDAHTLGINAAAELLRDCGYEVMIADDNISQAINDYKYEINRKKIVDWVIDNEINVIGLSYRLDKDNAINMLGYLIEELRNNNLFDYQGGIVKSILFGGLPEAAQAMEKEFKGLVKTYIGGETAEETLLKMGVPKDRIPKDILEGSKYDDSLLEFGKKIIDSGEYTSHKAIDRSNYPEFGSKKDTVVKRIDSNMKDSFIPLMRAHVGPYSSNATRMESVEEFISWTKTLAKTGFLDILSIFLVYILILTFTIFIFGI